MCTDAPAVDGLLEAAEGGSGAAEPPEMRLAVADALAATGNVFRRTVPGSGSSTFA